MGVIAKYVPIVIRDRYRHHWHKIRNLKTLPIVQETKWRFNKPDLPQMEDNSVNLHLGCGVVNHPAYINIDLIPHPHVHYLRPIDDLSIFADNSADLIYASHCLEHFSFRRVPAVLIEWSRVLKKDGTLRLSVPDFDFIIEIYQASGNRLDAVHQAIVGGQDYKYNFHYVVFNKAYLTDLLLDAGFTDVCEWIPGASELTMFHDWSDKMFKVGDKEFPISLNLEAKKL